MRKYQITMAVLLALSLVALTFTFFIDQNIFYLGIYFIVVLLIIISYANIVVFRKIARITNETKKGLDNIEKRVAAVEEKIKPMSKTYQYLRFLDEANSDIQHEYQKILTKYKNLLLRRK